MKKYIIILIASIIVVTVMRYLYRSPEDVYLDCYHTCAKKRGPIPFASHDICLDKCVPPYMRESRR